MTDDPWKDKLTKEQYASLRLKHTEPPFSGKLLYNTSKGDYVCAACGTLLFHSDSKYLSNTPGLAGWPSFSEVADSKAIELADDYSIGMHRVEAICKNCGSHLGHLFPDSESPSGQHYCINSASLDFKEKKS